MTPLVAPFGHPRTNKRGFVPRNPILGTIADLVATVGDTEVVLSWSAPVGVLGYVIEYKLSADPTWIVFEGVPAVNNTAFVNGLTNDAAYDFRVIALDDFTSTTSNVDSETPIAAAAGFGAVTDLAVGTPTDTTFPFSFTQVADDLGNPAKYQVRIRSPSIDENTWGEGTQIFVDTDLEIGIVKNGEFTGLTLGTTYQIMLIPFRGVSGSADAFGEFSNIPTAEDTTGSAALGTITNLSANPGESQVSLNWTPADNATSHQPEYKLDSSGTWLQFGSALSGTASSVTVTGLTNGSLYDFRVIAGDGSTTTTSNEDSATPAAAGENQGEPAGMTVLSNNDCSVVPGTNWSGTTTSKLFVVTDAAATRSPPTSIRHFMPKGTVSSGTLTGTASALSGVNHRYLYTRWSLRVSDPFQSHGSNVNKIFWPRNQQASSNAFVMLRSTNLAVVFQKQGFDAEDPEQFRMYLTSDADNEVSNGLARLTRGKEYDIAILLVGSTTSVAPHNGEYHMWLKNLTDGGSWEKKCQFTQEWLMHSSAGGKHTSCVIQYYWGGTGGTLNQNQWWDIDHFYVSGK